MEPMEALVQGSVQRVAAVIQDELSTILNSAGRNFHLQPDIAFWAAEVTRVYEQVASLLLQQEQQDDDLQLHEIDAAQVQGSSVAPESDLPLHTKGSAVGPAASEPLSNEQALLPSGEASADGTSDVTLLPHAQAPLPNGDTQPADTNGKTDLGTLPGVVSGLHGEGTSLLKTIPSGVMLADSAGHPSHDNQALLQTEPVSSSSSISTAACFNSDEAQLFKALGPGLSQLAHIKSPGVTPTVRASMTANNTPASSNTPEPPSSMTGGLQLGSSQQLSQDLSDQRNSNGSLWGSRGGIARMSEDSNNQFLLQQQQLDADAGAAAGHIFSRYVAPGAAASPSFLRNVHAALTAGNLGRPADDRTSAPAAQGQSKDGNNGNNNALMFNRQVNTTSALPSRNTAPVSDAQQLQNQIQVQLEQARGLSLSSPLYLVGNNNSDRSSEMSRNTPSGSLMSPNSMQSHGLLHIGGATSMNSVNSQDANSGRGASGSLSSAILAQQNMLQHAAQQQQQHQLQQQQLQQHQLMMAQAQEQQRLQDQLEQQLVGAGLVQYTDSRGNTLLGPAPVSGNNQRVTYQVDPVTCNLVAVLSSPEGDVYATVPQPGGHMLQASQGGPSNMSSSSRDTFNTGDPNYSLFGEFDLQPLNHQGVSATYLPNSAQQTLSMFAAAAAGQQRGGQLQAGSNTGDMNAMVGSNGQLSTMMHGPSSSPAPTQTLSLTQLSPSSAGVNSEPLPLLISGPFTTNAGGQIHHTGGYVTTAQGNGGGLPGSSPDLTYLAGYARTSSNGTGGLSGSTRLLQVATPLGLTTLNAAGLTLAGARVGAGNITPPSSPLQTRVLERPGRFKVLPLAVQQRIMALCRSTPVITIRDFDDKVVSKLSLLVDSWGTDQALAMLDHLEHRMRTKQGAMKNGPGYLDVAVCSHLDMLKAQGTCPKSMKLDEYAQQVLAPQVFHELCEAVNGNRWLAWEHFDQGIIQLVKRLPPESAVEKLQEITYHSFKNVDNIKGCIMSILNSKIREDRRRQ